VRPPCGPRLRGCRYAVPTEVATKGGGTPDALATGDTSPGLAVAAPSHHGAAELGDADVARAFTDGPRARENGGTVHSCATTVGYGALAAVPITEANLDEASFPVFVTIDILIPTGTGVRGKKIYIKIL